MGFSREENRSESIRKYITELKNKYESLKIICDESDCFIRTEEYERLSKEAKDLLSACFRWFVRDKMYFSI